jgi:opacity protein-like surface antigen
MSFMVNALYDIKTNTKLTPFVGAGLGILNGELDVRGDTADDTEFGYQIIAGATYNINNNIAIDLSYRFQQAPSDFSKDGVDIEYMSSLIMAGIRYNF